MLLLALGLQFGEPVGGGALGGLGIVAARRLRIGRRSAPLHRIGPFVIFETGTVTSVLLLNVALFLPVVLGGIAASWFGWLLAGPGGDGGGGGGLELEFPPVHPCRPWPVEARASAGPEDLARSG